MLILLIKISTITPCLHHSYSRVKVFIRVCLQITQKLRDRFSRTCVGGVGRDPKKKPSNLGADPGFHFTFFNMARSGVSLGGCSLCDLLVTTASSLLFRGLSVCQLLNGFVWTSVESWDIRTKGLFSLTVFPASQRISFESWCKKQDKCSGRTLVWFGLILKDCWTLAEECPLLSAVPVKSWLVLLCNYSCLMNKV